MSHDGAVVRELWVERWIPAERGPVFAAWTRPELLRRWASPEGLTLAHGELDLRVGGAWRVVMVGPRGVHHQAFGTFRDLDSPEWLACTHAWRTREGSGPETVLTVELRPEGGATRVVLTQAGFETSRSRDGHCAGWERALDRLAALFREVQARPTPRGGREAGGPGALPHQRERLRPG